MLKKVEICVKILNKSDLGVFIMLRLKEYSGHIRNWKSLCNELEISAEIKFEQKLKEKVEEENTENIETNDESE